MFRHLVSLFLLLGAITVLPGITDCGPPIDDSPTSAPVDDDGDGFASIETGGEDCDDADPAVNPGAIDDCDGYDTDCDGMIDNGGPESWPDRDGDGYGDAASAPSTSCQAVGYVDNDDDCNDHNATIYQGATELCDVQHLDNDCDGAVDEDSDGDGYDACSDCDPGNAASYPGVDLDGDGYDCDEECLPDSDDYDPDSYPGADEDPSTCH